MSPILFNLFVNDIFDIVNKNTTSDIYLENGENLNSPLYVDDLMLLSHSEDDLQKKVDILEDYCKKCKLNINEKIMTFWSGIK